MTEADHGGESAKLTLLSVLVENAVTRLREQDTVQTDTGEIIPLNLRLASYVALQEAQDAGLNIRTIFPTLVSQSTTPPFMPFINLAPRNIDFKIIACIEIINGEALRIYPDLVAESVEKSCGTTALFHD